MTNNYLLLTLFSSSYNNVVKLQGRANHGFGLFFAHFYYLETV